MAESYKSCQPYDDHNDKCFEILGFDILIDHKLKPWLLEVNHSPSFTIDTPFDAKVKTDLIIDTINILHMHPMKRIKFNKLMEEESKNRRLGKKKNLTLSKLTNEESAEHKKRHMAKRDKYELEYCGDYTRIYPDPKDPNKYLAYLNTANRLWNDQTPSKNKVSKFNSPQKDPIKIQAKCAFGRRVPPNDYRVIQMLEPVNNSVISEPRAISNHNVRKLRENIKYKSFTTDETTNIIPCTQKVDSSAYFPAITKGDCAI